MAEREYVKFCRTKHIPRRAGVRLAGGSGWEMPELLTVAQVAEILRLKPQTIRNWIDARTFPAMRIGRPVRVKREDLNASLEAGSTAGTDPIWDAPVGRATPDERRR